MRPKPVLFKILAAIMLASILGGCNAAQSVPTATVTSAPAQVVVPTETLAPTLDQNQLNTQSAQTAAAAETQNAPTDTPVIPTSTSTEAPTMTPTIAPTFTALPPTPDAIAVPTVPVLEPF